jgi:DNA segregation ATPase FtsK/SpoIIIE-like protein
MLLIISNYQLFAERPSAATALKKLIQSVIEARAMGIYLVITSTESGSHFIPAEIMGKCTTRIGFSLNNKQRTELFGQTTFVSEPIPGRGLIMTPDHKINQIQLALPMAGKSVNIRTERLKNELVFIQH